MAFSFLHKQKILRVLGIMNGTSLDGADFVLIEVVKKNLSCHYLEMKSFSFPFALRENLLLAASHKMPVDQLALLHHDLGRFYASCFKKLKMKKIDLIGLHGQTVFHKGKTATLQIGEPSYLAEVARVPVVSDFRVADLAVGGQGAPIATFFHERIFAKNKKAISVHNLGGISNLTLIKNQKVIQGFDTGPANMLMDMEIQRSTGGKMKFDRLGRLAKSGKPHSEIVQAMMKHPYLHLKAPKSCGREEFGIHFLESFKSQLSILSIEDKLSTLTEFVALSIAHAYLKHSRFIPNEVIFCGGGVNNSYLLQTIGKYLPDVKISTVKDYGWPTQSIEGAAFALLAVAKVLNKFSNVPQSTGARRKVSLGKITYI